MPLINVCRKNFTQSGQYCLACQLLQPHQVKNQVCTNCVNGFIYDGLGCTCTSGNQIIGQSCVGPTCGNGAIEKEETCDDGNINNNDGCSSACLIESGFFCRRSRTHLWGACGRSGRWYPWQYATRNGWSRVRWVSCWWIDFDTSRAQKSDSWVAEASSGRGGVYARAFLAHWQYTPNGQTLCQYV